MTAAQEPEVFARVMTPLGDTVVLELLPENRQRASGLWLPEGARVRYDLAKLAVIADCGPLVTDELAPDMEVLVAPFHDGVEVTVPGTGRDGMGRFRIVGQKAVVAVLSAQRGVEACKADMQRAWMQLVLQDPEGALAWMRSTFALTVGKH